MINIREHGGSFGGKTLRKSFNNPNDLKVGDEMEGFGIILYKDKEKNQYFHGNTSYLYYKQGFTTIASYYYPLPTSTPVHPHYDKDFNTSYFFFVDNQSGAQDRLKCISFNHNTNTFNTIIDMLYNVKSMYITLDNKDIFVFHTDNYDIFASKFTITSSGLTQVVSRRENSYSGYFHTGFLTVGDEIWLQVKSSAQSWGYLIKYKKNNLSFAPESGVYLSSVARWNGSKSVVAMNNKIYFYPSNGGTVVHVYDASTMTIILSKTINFPTDEYIHLLRNEQGTRLFCYSMYYSLNAGINSSSNSMIMSVVGRNSLLVKSLTRVWELDKNTLEKVSSEPYFTGEIWDSQAGSSNRHQDFYQLNTKGIIGYGMSQFNQLNSPTNDTLFGYKKII